MNSGKRPSVHLIGIGGMGLSAIARLLLESGYRVTGSDRQLSPLANSLREAGVQVYLGHRAENLSEVDLVIRSSAVPDDNEEVQAAIQKGIPVYKRSEFLGQLMAERQGIAIAGTHGKTTTTAMIAWMLTSLGQDPSYIIGGVALNLGTNAHAGNGKAFVIEADEYDRMFLGLTPDIAVVTNIEHDHPDCYPTFEDFYQAFFSFVCKLPGEGQFIGCADDPGVRRLMDEVSRLPFQTISYGIQEPTATFGVSQLERNQDGGYSFMLTHRGNLEGRVALRIPGLHNVRNALAALAVAQSLRLDFEAVSRAIGDFRGTGRRFEVCGKAADVVVIDDYAHHPTEIRATLSAARDRYAGRKIWAVWQPHTFSRTQTLFEEFVAAFKDADAVIVTEVYVSRETAQVGSFSAKQVVDAMEYKQAYFIPELDEVTAFLLKQLRGGEVLIVMSAGDADQVSKQVLAGLLGGVQSG